MNERTDGPADPQLANLLADLEVTRRQRDQAVAHARDVEFELGELRGKVKRLDLMMWRRTARRQRLLGWARRLRTLLPRRSEVR
jgi:hypothetical protein